MSYFFYFYKYFAKDLRDFMQNVLFHFITEKVLYMRNTINKQTNHAAQAHNKNRVPFQYAQYEKSYNK